MKRNVKNIAALMLMAAAIFTSCGGNSQMNMPTANFETMKVSAKEVTIESKYNATIRGRQDIDIMPQVGGTLQQLCVTEGQLVTKGQTLFVIDQVPYRQQLNTAQAALNAAKAQVATAELNYESRKKLHEEQVVSEFDMQTAHNQLLSAKAQVAQCEAAVANAQNSLSYTVVKSPSNGVVGTLPYRQGALVGPSMPKPLTTVSDNSQMYVYFSITEAQFLQMMRENGSTADALASMPSVSLKLVDGSEYNYKGTVESASGVVDRSTGTVQMRAVFDNPDKLLHSGSTGQVIVPMTYTDKIVIPVGAAVQTQDKYKVYVVDDKNIAHEQLIEIIPQSNGKEYIVTSGLTAGQTIVGAGAGMCKDGQDVKPNKEGEKKGF